MSHFTKGMGAGALFILQKLREVGKIEEEDC